MFNNLQKNNYFYPIVILLLFGLTEIIINPIGNFPLNDDWWYAHFYKKLFEEGTIPKLMWSSAGLYGQLLLTKPFALLFGFSFTSLRFFTLLLAALSLLFFYAICFKHLKIKSNTSFLLSLLMLFNPLFLNLSNSYMTDVPFLFMILGSIYFYLEYIEKQKFYYFVISLTFFCLGVLTRQMMIAFIAGIVLTEFFSSKKITFRIVALTIISTLTLLLFEIYMKYEIKSISYTYTILRNTTMLNKIPIIESIQFFAKRWVHYISLSGFALFPITIPYLFSYFKSLKTNSSFKVLIITIVFFIPVFISLLNFPLGNYIFDCGIGPDTLYDALIPTDTPYKFSSTLIFTVLKVITFIGAFGFLLAWINFLLKHLNKKTSSNFKEHQLVSIFLISLLFYYGFLAFNASLFDRYVLPFTILSSFILYKELFATYNKLIFSYILIVPIILFSSFGTKDYLNENRARWQAVYLLKKEFAATDMDINAGYEHEGSCFADSSFWYQKWCNKKPNLYLITRKKYKNYNPLGAIVFQRYMPFKKDSIFYSKLNQ